MVEILFKFKLKPFSVEHVPVLTQINPKMRIHTNIFRFFFIIVLSVDLKWFYQIFVHCDCFIFRPSIVYGNVTVNCDCFSFVNKISWVLATARIDWLSYTDCFLLFIGFCEKALIEFDNIKRITVESELLPFSDYKFACRQSIQKPWPVWFQFLLFPPSIIWLTSKQQKMEQNPI